MKLEAILCDVHTYLVVSFAVMLVVFFKLGRGRLGAWLDNGIENVRNMIDGLKEKKLDRQGTARSLEVELQEARRKAADTLLKAESEAKAVLDKAKISADSAIAKKKEEYADEVSRVKSGLEAALAKRCAFAISARIHERLLNLSKNDEEFQRTCIESAIKALSEYVSEKSDSCDGVPKS
jgi:F0F1-type ATP synthase membrane subunit b/b'